VLSTGGIPLIYLGDEVGQLNDYGYLDDPEHAKDSRWVNRPPFPADRYADRHNPSTSAGRTYSGLRRLIEVRRGAPELAGGRLIGFRTNNQHVLGYQRPGESSVVLVLANFDETDHVVSAETLAGFDADVLDLITGQKRSLDAGVRLGPYEFSWLRVNPI
jgi:amylosucrase